MKNHDYLKLLSSLDTAIEILERNRTPEPAAVAAFDTLKQARARIVRTLQAPASVSATSEVVPFPFSVLAA